MEIVYVGDRNPSNRALVISDEEWKRLGKIITKKMDHEDSVEASKRLKDMRREISQKMVDGWNNTEINKSKKLLEQKRKALFELETKRQQRDKEMKHEALEARNRVIEKARKLKFEERDETKTFNRALQHSEVFKERAIQLKFNKAEREKQMEKNLMIACDQNKEMEQYKKKQNYEKQKNKALKRAEAEMLLKELKEREDKRRDENIALYNSGKIEMQKIAEEIEDAREKAIAEAQVVKEKLQKDIEENRDIISRNDKTRQLEEQEEDMMTAIMAETKKILAKTRRLKEIELMEVRQLALEELRTKMAHWPVKDNGWAKSDIQNAIDVQEQRYKDKQHKRREQAKKKIEQVESGNKLWKGEITKQREQLALDHEWEIQRREHEKELLAEYAALCSRRQVENANEFRKHLDKQCVYKKEMWLADRQSDIDRHDAFEQQWHEEDKEFIAYAGNIIEKKKLTGDPVVPLFKTVKNYLKKNNLYMDQDNKVSKKMPKGPIYTSRIIRQID